jgi:hypothetical protein
MRILGVDGMSAEQIALELERGGRFVVFQYCVSIVVMTFRRPSSIHFVRAGEGAFSKGLVCTLVSLTLGWWGLPWGPIYTIGSVFTNLGGGKDVTREVLASLTRDESEAA